VAVEADWPDAYRINRYVRGASADEDAVQALADFGRFPTWMWRNADVLDSSAGSARTMTRNRSTSAPASTASISTVCVPRWKPCCRTSTRSIRKRAGRARRRYGCFDQFGNEMQEYGLRRQRRLAPVLRARGVITQLVELHRQRADYASRDGRVAADEYFFAEQNARLVKNAKSTTGPCSGGREASWNLRDRHMASRRSRSCCDSSIARAPGRASSSGS
jgi:erythromycin esterase-like protein